MQAEFRLCPGLNALDLGRSLGGGMNNEFLDPEQYFKFETSVRDDGTVEALWAIGRLLPIPQQVLIHRHRRTRYALGRVTMKPVRSRTTGRTEVYYQQAVANVPIVREASDG